MWRGFVTWGIGAVLSATGFALATLGPVPGAGASSPPPEGPALAFTAVGRLAQSGLAVNTIGYDASRSHVTVRGSQRGVVPKPLSGLSWSPDGSRLAFTGAKGNRSGIYTIRADGSGLRFLPGTKGGTSPVFSPDGRRIAFAREGNSWPLIFSSTPWIANVDGSGARRLVGWHKHVTYTPSSFSPDGSTLAVTRSDFGSEEPKILLFRLDRRRIRPLVERASEPVFSPDGARILYVKHSIKRHGKFRVTHRDLFAVSTDGKKQERFTRTPWVAETQPDWDPSGQRIAFNSFRISRDPIDRLFDELLPEDNSIVQMNADGTCREKLFSRHLLGVYGAKWRPGPGREAGRIECGLDGPDVRVPEGPRLATVKFSLSSFRQVLESVDETGAQPLRIAGGGEGKRPLPELFSPPAWSPDGSKIAFAGVGRQLFGGPRGTRVYVSRADGSRLRPLRGSHGADEPVFTPDGTAVAFTRTLHVPKGNRHGKKRFVEGGASVWLAGLAGGAPVRITPARRGLYVYASSFSPDGKTLLASRAVGRRAWQVVEIDLATRKADVLLRRAEEPVLSPDGSKIVFLRWVPHEGRKGGTTYTSDLFMIDAGGGGLRRLTKGGGNDRYPSWDPSGKRLAFMRYRSGGTELDELGIRSAVMQVNADGSCLSKVLSPARETGLYGAAWQPGPGREAGRIAC